MRLLKKVDQNANDETLEAYVSDQAAISLFSCQFQAQLAELYDEMAIREAQTPGFFGKIGNYISQKGTIKLLSFITNEAATEVVDLGNQLGESQGIPKINPKGVGMVVGGMTQLIANAYFNRKNQKANTKNLEAKNLLENVKKYGDIEKFKKDIANYLCVRYQYAIVELGKYKNRVETFANFLACIVGENLLLELLTKVDVIQLTKIGNDSDIYKFIKFNKKAKSEWTYQGLLTRAPLLTLDGVFWVKLSEKDDKSNKYPPQIEINTGEPIGYIPGYYKLGSEKPESMQPYIRDLHCDKETRMFYLDELKKNPKLALPGVEINKLKIRFQEERKKFYTQVHEITQKALQSSPDAIANLMKVFSEYTKYFLAYYYRLCINQSFVLENYELQFFRRELSGIGSNLKHIEDILNTKPVNGTNSFFTFVGEMFGKTPQDYLSEIINNQVDLNKLDSYCMVTASLLNSKFKPAPIDTNTDLVQLKIQREVQTITGDLEELKYFIRFSSLEEKLQKALLNLLEKIILFFEQILDVNNPLEKRVENLNSQKNMLGKSIKEILLMLEILLDDEQYKKIEPIKEKLIKILKDIKGGLPIDFHKVNLEPIEKLKHLSAIFSLTKLKDADFYFNNGKQAFDKKDWITASNYFTLALLREPKPEFYVGRGDAMMFMKSYLEALKDYQKAILGYQTSLPLNVLGLAETYYRSGLTNLNRAVLAYQLAEKLDNKELSKNSPEPLPQYVKAHDQTIAYTREAKRDCKQAIELLNTVNNFSKDFNVLKANVYYILGFSREMLSFARTYSSSFGHQRRNSLSEIDKKCWHVITDLTAHRRTKAVTNYFDAYTSNSMHYYAFCKGKQLSTFESKSSSVKKYIDEKVEKIDLTFKGELPENIKENCNELKNLIKKDKASLGSEWVNDFEVLLPTMKLKQ